ncbi:MAG: urease accessory protein UreD [Chloroflexota bacterium]
MSLKGRLSVRVGLENGHSVIRAVRSEFPLVALRSHPLPEAGWLALVVLTPSGGLLDGDELEAEIAVEAGAKLELRTQAATQLHRGHSSQRWTFMVEEGGCLCYAPHSLVPHAGAAHHSAIGARVAATGRLLIAEPVAPGRACLGEQFAYEELQLDLDIWQDGVLAARDRHRVRPGGQPLPQLGPRTHFASLYAIGPGASVLDGHFATPVTSGLAAGTSELAIGGRYAWLLAKRAYDLQAALDAGRKCWREYP